MSDLQGRIVGEVTYAEGDGIKMKIPPGLCEITLTLMDATISWSDGSSNGATAMPLDDYKRHLANGEIVLSNPTP